MTPRRIASSLSVAAGLVGLMASGAAAQTQTPPPVVALSGILGSKALLVIDDAAPRIVAPGESHRGVKVISTQADNAVLEIGGQRQTLRVGGAPVSVGVAAAPGTGVRIVLSADSGGHFVSQGTINSRAVQFLVDTGATAIGIGVSDAERIGLEYKKGEPVQVGTANGVARGWRVRLASVRLNDVEVREVDAVVTPNAMPFVLLGNSYLTRFQMTRNNEQLVLEKRY